MPSHVWVVSSMTVDAGFGTPPAVTGYACERLTREFPNGPAASIERTSWEEKSLHAAGHEVMDARDVGLRGRPDAAIAARAASETRIVVSADLDSANAPAFPPGTHPGIVVTPHGPKQDDRLGLGRAPQVPTT